MEEQEGIVAVSEHTNVLVLGGGPGGCAAAIAARRGGAHVTLLDRDEEPRRRPGETLHPGMQTLCERLGARAALDRATRVRHRGHWVRVGASRRFQPFGGDERGPWRGFQVARDQLDLGLRACAASAGVTIRTGIARGVTTGSDGRVTGVRLLGGRRVTSRLVVDATGPSHWLARRLGIGVRQLSPRYVATYGYVRAPRALAVDAELSADAAGWTWIARVGPSRWHWTRLSFAGRRMPKGWWPPALGRGEPIGPRGGADVTWRIADRVAGHGWFMVGDAAATLDPASSHGVLRAVMSGIVAGEAAAAICREPSAAPSLIARYNVWLHAGVSRDVELLRLVYEEWRTTAA